MPDILIYILFSIGSVILIGIPMILLTNKQPAVMELTRIDITNVSEDINLELFSKFSEEAKDIGFEKVLEFSAGSLDVKNFNVLFTSPDGTELLYSQMKTKQNKWFSYFEFCTKFADGTELNTRNSKLTSLYAPNPNKIIIDYPDMNSLDKMYTKHKEYITMDRKLSALSVIPLSANEFIEEFKNDYVKEMEYQVEKGVYKKHKTGKYYVPTLKLALQGVKNFVNPFADNFTLPRFIFGFGSGTGLIWLIMFAYTKGYLYSWGIPYPYFTVIGVFLISGLIIGNVFRGKTLIWGILSTLPPIALFYNKIPSPFLLFLAHFWITTTIEKKSKKM